MDKSQLKSARETYSYIPARMLCDPAAPELEFQSLKLKRSVPEDWNSGDKNVRRQYSSVALDQFHSALLQSENDNDIIHGFLSVVFWGYASGSNGRVRSAFALARTVRMIEGTAKLAAMPVAEIILHLRKARDLLVDAHIAKALLEVVQIQFVGMSFASKLLTFMEPNNAAVYDDVISKRLGGHADPELRSLFVSPKKVSSDKGLLQQAEAYSRWCNWCDQNARSLNAAGSPWDRWLDWDGSSQSWRAVDIERAFFALGRS